MLTRVVGKVSEQRTQERQNGAKKWGKCVCMSVFMFVSRHEEKRRERNERRRRKRDGKELKRGGERGRRKTRKN